MKAIDTFTWKILSFSNGPFMRFKTAMCGEKKCILHITYLTLLQCIPHPAKSTGNLNVGSKTLRDLW